MACILFGIGPAGSDGLVWEFGNLRIFALDGYRFAGYRGSGRVGSVG